MFLKFDFFNMKISVATGASPSQPKLKAYGFKVCKTYYDIISAMRAFFYKLDTIKQIVSFDFFFIVHCSSLYFKKIEFLKETEYFIKCHQLFPFFQLDASLNLFLKFFLGLEKQRDGNE